MTWADYRCEKCQHLQRLNPAPSDEPSVKMECHGPECYPGPGEPKKQRTFHLESETQ